MNAEKLEAIMLNNDWGTHMADGDNFYRLLFRLEKKSNMGVDEVKSLFASYKNWRLQMNALTQECHSNSTVEDRKAIAYATTLNDDLVRHIETIVTTVKCDDPNFMQQVTSKINESANMNE